MPVNNKILKLILLASFHHFHIAARRLVIPITHIIPVDIMSWSVLPAAAMSAKSRVLDYLLAGIVGTLSLALAALLQGIVGSLPL